MPLKHLKKIALLFLTFLFLYFPRPSFAAGDFSYLIERTYSVRSNKQTIHVTERRIVTNNTSEYIIPAGSKEIISITTFKQGNIAKEIQLKRKTLRITDDNGSPLKYSVSQSGMSLNVTVSYPQTLSHNDSQVFQTEYDTNELIEVVGKVTNVYTPGLASYKELATDPRTGTTTQILYKTFLEVPSALGKTTFILPSPKKTTKSTTTNIYEFSTKSITGKNVWLQIGQDQIYKFKMEQISPKMDFSTPDELKFLSQVKYSLLLPRSYTETNQKVLFTKVDPMPKEITTDSDGNVKATFYLDATKENKITIEGYITIALSNDGQKPPASTTIQDIKNAIGMEKYTLPAKYWESDNPQIRAKANELLKSSSVLETLQNDYKFIVSSIDYSKFKFGSANKRQGALATLNGGDSVCMEYSDLLIALARAQGIPARAAYGYGYDPKQTPDKQENHQWVEVWLPDYGWLSIDPTWGETGREFIGQDLDHVLWYVASENPETPQPLEIVAATVSGSIKSTTFEIGATDKIPAGTELTSLDDLVQQVKKSTPQIEKFARLIQTSSIGRSLVIILPPAVIILVIVIVISIISNLIKKLRSRRQPTIASIPPMQPRPIPPVSQPAKTGNSTPTPPISQGN